MIRKLFGGGPVGMTSRILATLALLAFLVAINPLQASAQQQVKIVYVTAFNDTNSNGVRDYGESKIANATVTLYNMVYGDPMPTGSVKMTTTVTGITIPPTLDDENELFFISVDTGKCSGRSADFTRAKAPNSVNVACSS